MTYKIPHQISATLRNSGTSNCHRLTGQGSKTNVSVCDKTRVKQSLSYGAFSLSLYFSLSFVIVSLLNFFSPFFSTNSIFISRSSSGISYVWCFPALFQSLQARLYRPISQPNVILFSFTFKTLPIKGLSRPQLEQYTAQFSLTLGWTLKRSKWQWLTNLQDCNQ